MLKLALLVLSLEAVAGEDTYTCDVADMRYLFARVKTVGKEIDNQVRDINTTVTTILDETNRRIDLLNSTLDAIRELLNNITKIIEINECLSSPCNNGATCNDNVNNYTCTCTGGWTGTHCDNDIDECSSNPCKNSATCVDGLDNYSCRCVAGYSGLNCQIDIDECSSNPCMNGATCVDGSNNYSCRCVAGYSGLHCQIDIDECSSRPCKNGAPCVDGLDNYSCRCAAGYSGINCQIDSGCNSTLTGPAGEVTSPNYPNKYLDFTNCYYRILVAAGYHVRIAILHFELEGRYDYLRIYDGLDTRSAMMGELSGQTLPDKTIYISTANVIFLQFTTDHSIVYSGFRLQYSEV